MLKRAFSIDLRALAVMRICLGMVLVADLLIRWPDLAWFMSDTGSYSVAASKAAASDYRFSLYWLFDGLFWVHTLFAINLVVAALFAAGVRTRLMSVLVFVFLASLHNRNPILLQGGDNLLVLLTLWSIFLPMGARLSVDAAMTKTRPTTDTYWGWGTVAILVQIMSVYFFSAFLKNGSEWMVDGTAIYYALHNDQVAHLLAPYWRDWHWLTVPMTHYVWWLELIGPLIALSPIFNNWARGVAAFCFITLEIGFLFNLNVGLFPFISITSLIILIPGPVWDWLGRWINRHSAEPMVMYYDEDCEFCKKTCHLIRAAFGLNAQIVPAQSHPEIGPLLEREFSWVLVVNSHRYLRWQALVECISRGRRFRSVSRGVAAFAPWGDAIYHWIGENRRGFGKLTAALMPWRESAALPPRSLQVVAAVLAVLVFIGNVDRLPAKNKAILNGSLVDVVSSVDDAAYPVRQILRLDQLWNMFAPYPQKNDGWFLMVGLTSDGDLVDVLQWELTEPTADKPQRFVPDQAKNYRWRKYLSRIKQSRFKAERGRYASANCRRWNQQYQASLSHSGAEWPELEAFNIYYVQERTPPMGQPFATEYQLLWRHHCLDKNRLGEDAVQKTMLAQGRQTG